MFYNNSMYFWHTGFSDGTAQGAEEPPGPSRYQGAACSSDPPIRLTVSVAPSEFICKVS